MESASVDANNFLEVVNLAFFDTNQNSRSRHEEALTSLMTVSPDIFVALCTSFFNDDKTPKKLRITISTVLKLGLKPTKGNENMSIWHLITQESKVLVQESGLMNLVDADESIKNAAASMVADVFVLDCQHDQIWGGLLTNLSNNLNHEDQNVQRSAILTLGYICEALHNEGVTNLTNVQVDAMITGICLGLKNYDEKTLTALKALEYSMNFLTDSIGREAISDYIMNLLMNIQITAIERGEVLVIRQNILCLTEICRLIFGSFEKYYTVVFTNLIKTYAIMNKEALMVANEFFMMILAKEEEHENKRYMTEFAVQLLEKLLESLLHLLPVELDYHEPDDVIEFQNSSLLLMASLNGIYLDLTFDQLIRFVQNYIERAELVNKCVALTALESLLECPRNQKTYDILFNVFLGIINLYCKKDIKLKIQTGEILKKVAQFYPDIFMEDQNFAAIYPILMRQFEISNPNFKVSNLASNTFDCLAENAHHLSSHSRSQLVINHEAIIERLLETLETPGLTLYYIDMIYSTTASLLLNIVPVENLAKWFENFWKRYETLSSNWNNEISRYSVERIFINLNLILQTLIRKSRKLDLGENSSEKLPIIFTSILDFFKNIGEPLPESLIFLVSLIELESEPLLNLVDSLIKNNLATAILQKKDPELFKAGIYCLGHLVKVFGEKMEPYMVDLLPFIIEGLNDSSKGKDLKIHMFFTMADITAYCPRSTYNHLDKILSLVEMGFAAVCQLQVMKDKETHTYCNDLKETLIEISMTIHHLIYKSQEGQPQLSLIRAFIPKIVEFVRLTTESLLNCKTEYLRDSLMLLMDIFFKDKNSELLNQQNLVDIYRQLQPSEHVSDIQSILKEVRDSLFNGQNPLQL